MQILVMAKQPAAGQTKTRLCPPCTPAQAAAVASAALADTLQAAGATRAIRHTLVLSGRYEAPEGWCVVSQRGDGLPARLANAFADTALPGVPTLLIGMDTPQITPALLDRVALALIGADAVLGPAEDGGWWALALRDPAAAAVLRDIPVSTPDTHALTVAALLARRLVLRPTARLRDVDTADDAIEVARRCPNGRFAAAVAEHVAPAVAEDMAPAVAEKVAPAVAEKLAPARSDHVASAVAEHVAPARSEQVASAVAENVAPARSDRAAR